jgi:hypothetical protein
MGVPDDLPTRMAYEQLHVLAGMAGKVSSGCARGVVVVCPRPVAGAAASKAGGVL